MDNTFNAYKDSYYRSLCSPEMDYDKVVDWIAKNNLEGPRIQGVSGEEFACYVVHNCIRSVLHGDAGNYCTTGMCLAVRASSNPTSKEYKRVTLAIKL